MEGEMGEDESDEILVEMAPCSNKTRKRNGLVNVNRNSRGIFPELNGKQLKVRVLKLNGTDIGNPSVPLSQEVFMSQNRSSKTKLIGNKRQQDKFQNVKDKISNNNTINGITENKSFAKSHYEETITTSIPPITSFGFDSSLSSLCANCGSCADSPQSIISEDTSSQASDSIYVKADQLLKRSNSSLSCESLHSQKVLDENISSPKHIGNCKWTNCINTQVDLSQLQDHIKTNHVQPQTSNGSYVCLWTGCKVYNKPALNFGWLERHVLHHSGDKPFKCIIDGCGSRFSSRYMLERHVRAHFDSNSNTNNKNGKNDGTGGTPSKCRKRKLKRRIARPIKTEDYFDPFVMENIKADRLCKSQDSNVDLYSSEATFRSTVIAKRQEPNGTKSVLLHWTPASIIPDEWVPEDQMKQVISIPLKALPHECAAQVDPTIYRQHRFRKHRRK